MSCFKLNPFEHLNVRFDATDEDINKKYRQVKQHNHTINQNKEKTMIVGLAGGQGTGKTTISSIIKMILEKYFKFNVFKISIDDFYKTRKERLKLSKNIHPLLMTRGVPGTHDIKSVSYTHLTLPTNREV